MDRMTFAPINDPEMARRVRSLGEHNPPALAWFDAEGGFHRRCITDEPNRDCNGCRETSEPPPGSQVFRWTPRDEDEAEARG